MTESDLISEEHAAELTRSSVKTLEQFSAAGLIEARIQGGSRYYEIKDLEVLFHIDRKEEPEPVIDTPEDARNSQMASSFEHLQERQPISEDLSGSADALSKAEGETTKLSEMIERITVDPTNIDLVRKNQSLIEQLEELKEERNWLRKRLESAENRIERDQMLLISKSETIRQLVVEKSKPSWFWSFALPLLRPFEDLRRGIAGAQTVIPNQKTKLNGN